MLDGTLSMRGRLTSVAVKICMILRPVPEEECVMAVTRKAWFDSMGPPVTLSAGMYVQLTVAVMGITLTMRHESIFVAFLMAYLQISSLPRFMFQFPFSGDYIMQALRLLNGEKP